MPTYSHLSNKRGVTLIDFEKKINPPRTFPPSTFIDFSDFFHPPLHVYCIYILVFSKKSHPPRLFQPARLVIWQILHPPTQGVAAKASAVGFCLGCGLFGSYNSL